MWRGCKSNPRGFLVVREIDRKILRNPVEEPLPLGITRIDKPKVRKLGSSEQALRASLRTSIITLGLTMINATADEMKFLRQRTSIGHRAPSCSLLPFKDAANCVESFGKYWTAAIIRNIIAPQEVINYLPLVEVPNEDILPNYITTSKNNTEKQPISLTKSTTSTSSTSSTVPLTVITTLRVRKQKKKSNKDLPSYKSQIMTKQGDIEERRYQEEEKGKEEEKINKELPPGFPYARGLFYGINTSRLPSYFPRHDQTTENFINFGFNNTEEGDLKTVKARYENYF